MRDIYSLYEAKARLSAIVRRVREGHTVVVTVHGEPAVEIRPVARVAAELSARLDALTERGILVAADDPNASLTPGKSRPGALRRFLVDRNR